MTYEEFEGLCLEGWDENPRGDGTSYALRRMEIGESVLVPDCAGQRMRTAASRLYRRREGYWSVQIQRCLGDGSIEGYLVTRGQ